MASIKSISIIGAGGNVGKVVLPLFLDAGFDVTVVSRHDSKSVFPSDVKVVKTDYSLDHLTKAFQGQDAVLALIDSKALDTEATIVDAAAAAGVKWFVPSEFGHDTTNEQIVSLLPIFKGKNKIIDHLRAKEQDGLSWTGIITGLFFDWGLGIGFLGFDFKNHTAKIWDEGTTPFLTTNIPTIGRALVTLLSNPSAREAFKNKHAFISSFSTTQNEVLAAVEEATGDRFSVTKVSSKEIKDESQAKLSKGDFSAIGPLIQYVAWGEEGQSQWTAQAEQGNKLLLPGNHETVQESVRKVVAKSQ